MRPLVFNDVKFEALFRVILWEPLAQKLHGVRRRRSEERYSARCEAVTEAVRKRRGVGCELLDKCKNFRPL
jgi:hypothetical protein